jgi:WD40 repeat protein
MNNLPAINQEAHLILGKISSLIKITNKILTTRSTALASALQYKPFIQVGYKAYSVSISTDGKKALLGNNNEESLKLWYIVDGENLGTFSWHTGSVNSVTFSPDGKIASSGSGVFVWHVSLFLSAAYSPDGKMVLTEGGDNYPGYDILELWDVSTDRMIRTFDGDIGMFTSATFSPDGKTVLSGGFDNYSGNGILKLWDISTGMELQTFEGHKNTVNSVAFSPNGKMALSGSRDCTLKLWDIGTGKEIRTFKGHTTSIDSIAFSPDGKMALSRSGSEPLKLWDINTNKEIQTTVTFEDREWVTITPEGYFDHSENGRQYLNVLTSPMNAIAIDDATYNHYYRPNGILDNYSDDDWINRLWAWADENKIEENIFYEVADSEDPALFMGGWHFIFTFSKDKRKQFSVVNSVKIKEYNEIYDDPEYNPLDRYDEWDVPNPYDLNIGISRNKERLLHSEILDLSNNNLAHIPEELVNLKNLQYLNLMNNNLSSLPNKIGNLSKLKVFCCNGDLKTLPESIIMLTNLEELILYCKLLVLSAEQKQWIVELQKNGCFVEMYSNNQINNFTEMDINEDEIPF